MVYRPVVKYYYTFVVPCKMILVVNLFWFGKLTVRLRTWKKPEWKHKEKIRQKVNHVPDDSWSTYLLYYPAVRPHPLLVSPWWTPGPWRRDSTSAWRWMPCAPCPRPPARRRTSPDTPTHSRSHSRTGEPATSTGKHYNNNKYIIMSSLSRMKMSYGIKKALFAPSFRPLWI